MTVSPTGSLGRPVRGPIAVGAYVAVRLALIAVGLPFTSILVDRLPRKLFMIMADLVRAGLVIVAAALVWLGGPAIAVIAASEGLTLDLRARPFLPGSRGRIGRTIHRAGHADEHHPQICDRANDQVPS